MCGIYGYIGEFKLDFSGFLLDGLSKLEYRGYDSAGIAVLSNDKVKVVKEVGEIKKLKERLKGKIIAGDAGIGHTRWATHGGVVKRNSHPHTDCSGRLTVVHNGIIENFEKLKKSLIKKGHKFRSETDTEVFIHLVEEKFTKKGISFREAVRLSFNEITGLNAVVVLSPDREIVAFRKGSLLVAGLGKKGNYISSDIPALISKTRKIVLIDDGQGIILSKNKMFLINPKDGKLKKATFKEIKMEEVIDNKGNYKHFLLKEIHEQPEVILRVATNNEREVRKAAKMIKDAWGTYFTACGTAAHAGLAATYMFSEIAKRHVNFTVASEFTYFEDFLTPKSLLIVASQSGETMDALEAVRAAKRHKSKILALVNVPSSSLSRMADYTMLLKAGPERAVLSTKAYMAKLSLFLLFAFTITGKYKKGVSLLKSASIKVREMLADGLEKDIKKLAKRIIDKRHIYIIGRGVNYATALEGALKIKEASYIHAEGFAGGELKHGVIALVEKGTPCIVIVAEDRAKEAVLSNAAEMKTRGAYIIGISPKRSSVFDYWIPTPDVKQLSPLVSVIPMQLLAYHLAVLKGRNPDKPRNLAKSVTVK